MYNTPAYNYGAVIAYNTARTPGLGSAIFLHVSTGGSTAGCVALPQGQLLEVLRWLDPAQQPRIVMGTARGRDAVTRGSGTRRFRERRRRVDRGPVVAIAAVAIAL